MIERYLTATYEDGGRALPCIDCWGLTILARHEMFGLPMLSSFGEVRHSNPRAFQRAYHSQVQAALEECRPFPGAIAAALHGDLCVHVGLVVEREGRLQVLEINPGTQARIVRLQDFRDRDIFTKVIFYRDRILREQAGPGTAPALPDQ